MVLDIRGTNGAGKSWVVHQLLGMWENCPVNNNDGKLIGYECENGVGIVGTYETECGGCDSIKSAQAIEDRVRLFHSMFDHVVFEGITISHTASRYAKLADEFGDYHFLFLTTPVKVCIDRVRARREAKGNFKPFDPDKKMGLRYDYDRVRVATYNRLIAGGYNVIDLDWQDPLPQVLGLLNV